MNDAASRDVKVLVVGNPANTNALIARENAPDIDPRNFTAMTRLDHNRSKTQLAVKAGAHVSDVRQMTIWGNHSSTMYPDISHATIAGEAAAPKVPEDWYRDDFIPTVQQRGAAILKARGASSAASAASAAIDHMHDWINGTPEGDWVSMGVASDGSYGIAEGVVYSYPVTCSGGEYTVVDGLEIDEFGRTMLDATDAELREEREGVADLL
jgi:malate dehydrogenase